MKNFLYITIILIIFYPHLSWASQESVLINEIAWMGGEVSSSDEWIELYNNSEQEIALDGWLLVAKDGQPLISLTGTLLPNSFLLLERTDDDTVSGIEADIIYSGSLSNTGEYMELLNVDGNIVDFVDSSLGWNAGDNTTKKTMERNSIGDWQTSLNPGGTPRATNHASKNILDNIEEEITSTSIYKYGDILINEIVSDPGDGDTEWVEIFNNTKSSVDLNNWYIEEGSGTKTFLEDVLLSRGLLVIDSLKGNLNNKGDQVLLFTDKDVLVSSLSYGDWESANKNNNAPAAEDPNSLSRIGTLDTKNSKNDFSVSPFPTKGEVNIIQDEQTSNNLKVNSNTLIVSEIFPNPIGDDTQLEFIELYNYGEISIDLFGWTMNDNSKNKFNFKNGDKIDPGTYLVINRAKSNIALNNSG